MTATQEDDARYYARNTDPDTSHESAELLQNKQRNWRTIMQFLHENDRVEGWADFEINREVGEVLGRCWWHRVSDVRRQGWAAWVEGERRYNPETNRRVQVSRITDEGREWLGVLA